MWFPFVFPSKWNSGFTVAVNGADQLCFVMFAKTQITNILVVKLRATTSAQWITCFLYYTDYHLNSVLSFQHRKHNQCNRKQKTHPALKKRYFAINISKDGVTNNISSWGPLFSNSALFELISQVSNFIFTACFHLFFGIFKKVPWSSKIPICKPVEHIDELWY